MLILTTRFPMAAFLVCFLALEFGNGQVSGRRALIPSGRRLVQMHLPPGFQKPSPPPKYPPTHYPPPKFPPTHYPPPKYPPTHYPPPTYPTNFPPTKYPPPIYPPPIYPPPIYPPPIHPPPIYPPHGNCDLCNKLTEEFDKAFGLVTWIHEKIKDDCPTAPPPPVCDPGIFFTFGPEKRSGNAASNAKCFSPNSIIGCRCSDEDGKSCQGARIVGINCQVKRNKEGNGVIKAIATCIRDHNDDYVVVREPSGGLAVNPIAQCPEGKRIADCIIDNSESDSTTIGTRINIDTASCQPTEPCSSQPAQGCQIHAMCV